MAKKVMKLDLPAPKVTVSKYVVDDIQTGLQRLTLPPFPPPPPLHCTK